MNTTESNRTIEAYSRNARNFEETVGNNTTYAEMIRQFQKAHIQSGANLLDLGCGPGNTLRTLLTQDNSLKITAVDLSPKMIELARAAFPQGRFLVQDIRQLDLDDLFDVIIASFCIVHLTDSEAETFFQQVAQHLNTGGMLYLSFMEGEGAGFETTSFSQQEIYFNYYTVDIVMELLRLNGFSLLQQQKKEYREPDNSITTDVFLYAQKAREYDVQQSSQEQEQR